VSESPRTLALFDCEYLILLTLRFGRFLVGWIDLPGTVLMESLLLEALSFGRDLAAGGRLVPARC
jgi:hypothetical protein